jgi:hypothetical protein
MNSGDNTAAMNTVQEIECAVRQLLPKDLALFRAWFIEFSATLWDRRFEADALEGQLDDLAAEALRDLLEGRCTEL